MIFITGGTGLVGCNLLLRLTSEYEKIIAFRRVNSDISIVERFFIQNKAIDRWQKIEWRVGDLSDISSLPELLQGVTTIFHAAAMVSFDPKKKKQLWESNVEVTTNLVNAAIEAKVEEFIYLSSIATMDDRNPITKKIDEDSYFNQSKKHSPYALTKFRAEMEVWRGSQEGLSLIHI